MINPITIYPQSERQKKLFVDLAKELDIAISNGEEEKDDYNPLFVEKILKGDKDFQKGRFRAIKTEDLWK